ncbi:MAG: hypothetical protein PHP01_07420 [Phycisphaerae bacterium]|nr:hypothetical protein [Phycisphaerae bacterium]
MAEAILRWIPAFAGMTVMFGNNGEITAFGRNSILFYGDEQTKMPVKIKEILRCDQNDRAAFAVTCRRAGDG